MLGSRSRNGWASGVTTGSSYTVASAVQAVRASAERMGLDLGRAVVAIVGATGAVGKACGQLLARECQKIVLIARDTARLCQVRSQIEAERGALAYATTEYRAIKEADVVVAVTSDIDAVIEPHHLRSGTIVLDVARPRDVSRRVAEERDDVLVIEGGMVAVPGPNLDFGFDFGFPPRMAYACMAEAMILALEGRHENYTLGRDVGIQQVQEIESLGVRHGFELGGFRCFERAVTDEDIERVKKATRLRSLGSCSAGVVPFS